MSQDLRREGEHEIDRWGPSFGGLSTTPSAMDLIEKSIVELAIVAEQRKFPLLKTTN